ncbi:MAG: hypothetical protein ACKOB8_03470 [Mycobacterium sp.]
MFAVHLWTRLYLWPRRRLRQRRVHLLAVHVQRRLHLRPPRLTAAPQ